MANDSSAHNAGSLADPPFAAKRKKPTPRFSAKSLPRAQPRGWGTLYIVRDKERRRNGGPPATHKLVPSSAGSSLAKRPSTTSEDSPLILKASLVGLLQQTNIVINGGQTIQSVLSISHNEHTIVPLLGDKLRMRKIRTDCKEARTQL